MEKKDFDFIKNALRDIIDYVNNIELNSTQKTLSNERLFNFADSDELSRERERRRAQLDTLLSGRAPKKGPADAGDKVASQLNCVDEKKGVFGEQEEIKIMLLRIPGASVAKNMRSDGRYQGYLVYKGKRHYFYGHSRIEVAKKIKFAFQYGIKQTKTKNVVNGIPQNFDDFAVYYFEKFRKKKVAQNTHESNVARYKKHLEPYFKNKAIKKITPSDCQDLLDNLNAEGKHKTASEIYFIMSTIFKGAISHGIINKNPLDIVVKESYEREHGTALTDEEIKTLISAIKGETYEVSIAIMLYTGLRPNELETVRIEGEFIVARNSKRKGKKIEYKKIPITPMLAPYLSGELRFTPADYLRRMFKKILPKHQLYDLRHTFYTKCIECHVDEVARKHFVGHSLGALGNTYTHLSDNYLLEEGKKIRF